MPNIDTCKWRAGCQTRLQTRTCMHICAFCFLLHCEEYGVISDQEGAKADFAKELIFFPLSLEKILTICSYSVSKISISCLQQVRSTFKHDQITPVLLFSELLRKASLIIYLIKKTKVLKMRVIVSVPPYIIQNLYCSALQLFTHDLILKN